MLKNYHPTQGIIRYLILFCVLFSLTTCLSSLIQLLIKNQEFDSNVHILLRGSLCLIGAGIIMLSKCLKLKNRLLQEFVHYILSLTIVLIFIYLLSFFIEVSGEHPYLGLIINWTAIYGIVFACMELKKWIKNYHKLH